MTLKVFYSLQHSKGLLGSMPYEALMTSIEEALALADRVVVFTARPGQIKAEIPITAPRPRDMRSPEMIDLAIQCEALLAEEVEKSFKDQEQEIA